MKKLFFLSVAILLFAGISTNLMAQTATANAGAKIVVASTVVKNTDLHFGTMSVPTAATTVVVSPENVRTAAAGIILLPGTPASSAASYTVTGPSGGSYQITLPTSILIHYLTFSMTVDNFTCSEADLANVALAATTGTFSVGATLNLPISQDPGDYTGQFDVIVTTN
jgi:hypothetical protein